MAEPQKSRIKNALLGIFYPRGIKCIVCDDELNEENRYCVCHKCVLPLNDKNFCHRCGAHIATQTDYCENCKRNENGFEVARSAFVYRGEIARLIQGLKYDGKQFLAPYLAQFMADVFKREHFECDYLVPVPLSQQRLREREYNQAELLARGLGKILGFAPIDALIRKRHTQKQTGLSPLERAKNVAGCYELNQDVRELIKGKKVVLIDDVLTTGATVNECARVLKKGGVASIIVLTLASAERKLFDAYTGNQITDIR